MRRALAAFSAATTLAGGAAAVSVVTVAADVAAPRTALALDDGLARTPPMGFNNWNSTHCGSSFNETMIKSIADLFVSSGLKDAGYQYVNIDDCWALPQRDPQTQRLVADPKRFPDGIKALADYVHGKGLKFGIYTSAGTHTCNSAGFPGGLGFEDIDAQTFADWGVDYLKYDNCNNQNVPALERYPRMRDALAKTGRPIVYSITEWGQNDPWEWGADVGHLWRTTGDIGDNYASMLSIVNQNAPLAPFAGPGHWNDPDMLEVGNGGMTDTEYRSHFSLWSIMAAPLLIGTDLRKATPATFDILRNTEVVAVDQDPLGRQGVRLSDTDGRMVFAKPLAGGDVAVALFNSTDRPAEISASAESLGLPAAPAYAVRDLWAHRTFEAAGTVGASVPAHGTAMYRISTDPRWAQHPPVTATTLDAGSLAGDPTLDQPVVVPGTAARVSVRFTNHGRVPALDVRLALAAPSGWTLTPTSPAVRPQVGTEQPFAATWSLTAPAGTPPGTYELTAGSGFTWAPGGGQRETATSVVRVVLPTPPPAGTAALSDVPPISASNGWGPVERDESNGEQAAGDGHRISIAGVTYDRGLGVHAPSDLAYFLGGNCTTVTADVGIDDEKRGNRAGSVEFTVVADGRTVADSGVTTWEGTAPIHLSADVTGADFVHLVVDDGPDTNSDHADWANAQLTCAP